MKFEEGKAYGRERERKKESYESEDCRLISHRLSILNCTNGLCRVLPNTDHLVGVTSKDGVGVSAPGNTDASRVLDASLEVRGLLGELSDAILLLEVEDLDAVLGGSTKPVLGGVEDELINLAASLELVHALALLEVPDEDGALLASSSAEGALRRNTDSVQVASGAGEVELQLEVLTKAPDLDETIPAAGNSNRGGRVGREGNVRGPLGVTVLLKSELALTESVPQLDATVTAAGHDLTVVSREGASKNILGVANEATSAHTVGEIPQTKGVIPAARESVVAIVRQLHVLDKVAVAVETTLSMSILLARAGQLPHHDSLVPRTRDEQVRALASSGQGSDCSIVSSDLSGKLESHFELLLLK
jgi:hypothetical protein